MDAGALVYSSNIYRETLSSVTLLGPKKNHLELKSISLSDYPLYTCRRFLAARPVHLFRVAAFTLARACLLRNELAPRQ